MVSSFNPSKENICQIGSFPQGSLHIFTSTSETCRLPIEGLFVNQSLKVWACRHPSPSWLYPVNRTWIFYLPTSPRYGAARLAVALNCRKSRPSLQSAESVESVKTSARVTCGHPDVGDVPSAIFAWQCHSLGTCFFGWKKMEKHQRSLRIWLKSYQCPGPDRKVIFQLPTIHFWGYVKLW